MAIGNDRPQRDVLPDAAGDGCDRIARTGLPLDELDRLGLRDDTNLEACARLLTSLKRNFRNMLVISHVDSIKDIVDNVIEISHDGIDARVRY